MGYNQAGVAGGKPGRAWRGAWRSDGATPDLRGGPGVRLLNRMKVSFTAKEYARLLELVYLGLGVTGAQSDDPQSMPERYAGVTQKTLALAETFGCADLVEVDAAGQFFPSAKLEEGPAREKLEKFVGDSFWAELASRLAERDLRAELGATKISDELAAEEIEKLEQLEDGYWREFETNGVDHVQVLRGGHG